MKLVIRSAVVSFILFAAMAANALTLVDFDASVSNFTGPYVGVQRIPVENTAAHILYTFDTGTPLFPLGSVFYGGLDVTNTGPEPANGSLNSWRYHNNAPPGWPNVPMVFYSTSDSTAGTNQYVSNVIYLWLKADFTNGGALIPAITFTPSDELSVSIGTGGQWWGNALFRFVVRDSDQYYVSEASTNFPGYFTFALTDFSTNSAQGHRWAPYGITTYAFATPDDGSLSFAAHYFTNVTAVGWMGRGNGPYFRMFAFDKFSASGIPEPAVAGLALAILAVLCRRTTHDRA
jgi:hypothetical protein